MKRIIPHGIMFHHFYDGVHPKGQGALSGKELDDILCFIGLDNILSAKEFQERAILGKLRKQDVCITFDDNLKCQYDVAYPVLKKYNIKAFWFIYTSPFEGVNEKLEVYRYYRTVRFSSINNFYRFFFNKLVESEYQKLIYDGLKKFNADEYLNSFSFYSHDDKKFRFIRDEILKDKYFSVMDGIIERDDRFSIKKIRDKLWIDTYGIKHLHKNGHIIGLHSHSHPTGLARQTRDVQTKEYSRNYNVIKNLLHDEPKSVSYPCNSYNKDTLRIMRDLNIKIGFKATMSFDVFDPLIIPRKDHANIQKEMKL
jgi:Polysaccharide deacetylase.